MAGALREVPEAGFGERSLAWLRRCDARTVLLILLLALAVRLVCLSRSDLIGTDSMRFLQAAQHVESGRFQEAIRDPFHPELSFLIALLNQGQQQILGAPRGFDEDRERRERTAYAIVLATGLLWVWLMIDLTRTLFPAVPPGAVGLLAACQPYLVRSSADIMSDTPMLAWLMLALRAAAAPPERLLPALVCGLSIGLAYLARPEGLVALPTVLVFWLLRERRSLARIATRSGLMLASLACVALPYVIAISMIAGKPTLTLKKDVYRMIGIEEARSGLDPLARTAQGSIPELTRAVQEQPDDSFGRHSPARFGLASAIPLQAGGRLAGSIGNILTGWFKTAPEVLALCFMAGLWALWRHGARTEGHTLFALCAGFTVAVLLLLAWSEPDPDYLSRRHVFILVALSLPLAARGLLALGAALGERVGRIGAPRGSVLVLAVTVFGLSLHATSAHRDDQLAQRTAARWIVAKHGYGEIVFTNREKVAYYAGATARHLPADAPTLLRRVRSLPRAWVAFYHEGTVCCGELAAALEEPGSPLRLVQRLEEPGARPPRTLLLYLSEQQ
jgi:hypothetical protein